MKTINENKKAMILFFTIMIMLNIIMPVSYAKFPDLRPDHWCYEKITNFEEWGYVSGYPDGTFIPDGTITRAEYVTIVNNFFGYEPKSENTGKFSDVTVDDWFSPYVSEAVERGYISGYPDGTFRPDAPIRRQEATVILSKILNIHDEDYENDHEDGLYQYPDGADTEEWAYKAVRNYSIYNFINGYEDGTLRILRNVSRAETVQLLNNLEQQIIIDRDDKTAEIKDKPSSSKKRVNTPVITVVEADSNNDGWYNMSESLNDGKITIKVKTSTSNATIIVTVNGQVVATTPVAVSDGTEVEFELTDGIYTIEAIANKSGYKTSYKSNAELINIDTKAPTVMGNVNEVAKIVDLYYEDNLSGIALDGIQYAWFVKDGEEYKRVSEWENISSKVPFPTEPQNYFIGVKGSDIAGNKIDGGLIDDNTVTGFANTNEPYRIIEEITIDEENDKEQEETEKPSVGEFAITYHKNDGTGKTYIQKLTGNATTLKNEVFARDGYTFVGWSESADGEVKYNGGATVDFAENKDLYAIWKLNSSTGDKVEVNVKVDIKFVAGNNGILSGDTKFEVIYGTRVSDLTVPTPIANVGYEFDKWTPVFSEIITESKEYTAVFKAKEYTLTIDPNGGTWNGFTTEQNFAQEYNSTMDIEIPESYDGHIVTFVTNGGEDIEPIAQEMKFDYWDMSGEGTLNGSTFTFGLGDATLTAEYEEQEVKLPTPIKPGYEFLGWYTNPEFDGEKLMAGSYMPVTSITLYANWIEKDPEFTVVKDNNYPKNGKYAEAGTIITYTITVKNEGEKEELFTVVDDLTAKPLIDIKNISHGGVLKDEVITWNITVEAGKKVDLRFDATVSDAIKTGEIIENIASVSVRGHEDTNKVVNVIEKTIVSKAIARVETIPDMNVVLALDLSGSMNAAFEGTTRLGAAKQAAATFITNLYENADKGQNITVTLVGFNKQLPTTKFYINEICTEEHTHGEGCALIDDIARKQCLEAHDHVMSKTCYPFSDLYGGEVIIFNSEGEMQRTATRDNYEDLISKLTNNVTYRLDTFLAPAIIRIDMELDRIEEEYPSANNVVVVLADGQCADSTDLLCAAVDKVETDHNAKFYSIAFGPAVNNPTDAGYKVLQQVASNDTVYASNALDELIGNFSEILESIKGTDYIQSENGIITFEMETNNCYPLTITYKDVDNNECKIVINDESQLAENNISIDGNNILTWEIDGEKYHKCTDLVLSYNKELPNMLMSLNIRDVDLEDYIIEEEQVVEEDIPVVEEEQIVEDGSPVVEEELVIEDDTIDITVAEEEPVVEEDIPVIEEEIVIEDDVIDIPVDEEEPVVEEDIPMIEEEIVIEDDVIDIPVDEEEPVVEEDIPVIEEEIVIEDDVIDIPVAEEESVVEEDIPMVEEEIVIEDDVIDIPVAEEETVVEEDISVAEEEQVEKDEVLDISVEEESVVEKITVE